MEGSDVNAGEVRRTWGDWLLIGLATLIFLGLGVMARAPHMDIQTGWLWLFAAALAGVVIAGGVALWRVTKFT